MSAAVRTLARDFGADPLNLLLILLAMLTGLSGAQTAGQGVSPAEVQQSRSAGVDALQQRVAAKAVAAHRELVQPLPTLARLAPATPRIWQAPVRPVRSIVEVALE